MLYLLVSSSLELKVLCLSQTKVTALIVQKWVWLKNFRARYAHSYILCPHNHKHLPTPMILCEKPYKFDHLCSPS